MVGGLRGLRARGPARESGVNPVRIRCTERFVAIPVTVSGHLWAVLERLWLLFWFPIVIISIVTVSECI